jgi:hypothetical protein
MSQYLIVVYRPVSSRETATATETDAGSSPKPSQSRLVSSKSKKAPKTDAGTATTAEIVTRSAASISSLAETIAMEKPIVVPVVAKPMKAVYRARYPMSDGV